MPIIISGSTGIAGVDGSASTPAVQGTDTNTGVYFGADTISFSEGGALVGQFDSSANFQFNSGYGSVATAYGCRAWVNFNGDGTIAIRASAGVTSLTDNGTGQYTINLSFTMPDSNYAVVGSAGSTNNAIGDRQLSTYPVNTTSCKVVSGQTASVNVYDATQVHVAIFR